MLSPPSSVAIEETSQSPGHVDRLAAYPEALRATWHAAAWRYDEAARTAADGIAAGLVAPAAPLMDFVEAELSSALRAEGIEAAPDTILIRRSIDPPTLLGHAAALIAGPETVTMPLSQFALENAGRDASDGLTVLDTSGQVHPVLAPSHIRGIVRRVDAGRRYLEHVEDTLGGTPMGLLNREYANTLWLARMRLEAADARLRHHDRTLPHGFLPDARERAFHWVANVLAHPTQRGRQPVDGMALQVEQLVYRGSAVTDVLLIRARHETESRHVVLYTPEAPDGLAFREFRDPDAMREGFLLDRRFEPYLLRRLPARFSTLDDHGLPRFEVSYTSRTVQWTFGGSACGFCTVLEEPFTYREVSGNIADATYDAAIALTENDTAHFTRSTAQADEDDVVRKLRLIRSQTQIMGSLFAELGLATLRSVPQMAQASWRFYDEARAGRADTAFLHAVDGYVAALNVLPFYATAPRSLSTRIGSPTAQRRALRPHKP